MSEKVDASSTCCNMLLQLGTTKFCCVTMFEVGGNTSNNAFQLATQQCCVKVEGKCCQYYRALNEKKKQQIKTLLAMRVQTISLAAG